VEAEFSEADLTAIHQVFEQHREFSFAGDNDADALLYSEDAVRLPPNGPPIEGREAILASMAQFDSVLKFDLEMIEVEGSGDLAYVWNDYKLSVISRGSSEPVSSSGKAILILRRGSDGQWLFHRVIWNSNDPPPS
jgi:uncharacterized protein (TIGR02246 family)